MRRALSQMEGEQRQQAKKEKENDNERSSARNALEKRVAELKVSHSNSMCYTWLQPSALL
jgi:ribosomal protein L9